MIRRLSAVSVVLVLLVSTLVVLATGCGAESGGSVSHPTGGDEIVLQIASGGGLVPVEFNLTALPELSLYGDGTVIVNGPVDAMYPGRALPNLQTTTLSEEVVQAVLSAATEAGLFDTTFDYGQPTIADGTTTSIEIVAGETTRGLDIYALGIEDGAGGLTVEQQQARAALNEFRRRLVDLTTFVEGEVIWSPYQFSALAVFSQPMDPSYTPDPSDVQPNHLDWPLGDLASLGEEVPPGFRRTVVSGTDLASLQPLLSEATAITLWNSGNRDYRVFFRPLLPEESE